MIPLLLFALALPLVEVPVQHPAGRFAVIVTGDGGWKKIDATIAKRLKSENIPTVGFDAASYYHTRRTPEESAAALEQVIREYRAKWRCDRVLLIGYSRGADVLPFMINRLSDDLRPSIAIVALLGTEPTIDFKLYPWWHFWHRAEPQVAVEPEVDKLRGLNVLCIHGLNEKDSLCPRLDPSAMTILGVPGGHHFAGNYREVADAILARVKE